MGHKFERVRMEPQRDGSVNIGIAIVATLGTSDVPDPAIPSSAEWARCAVASPHVHGWDSCDINGLFRTREKNAQGADIVGSSKKEKLIAWLQGTVADKDRPKEVALPTKKVTQDGKDVDVPDRDISV